uniref:Bacteriophage Mu C operon 5' region involved in late gene transcription n=1 Tax=Muvirus mu TaxID=10677 RepID=Q38622_9CAUD|nr:unnamed protein product [Escherichia phage Mu]
MHPFILADVSGCVRRFCTVSPVGHVLRPATIPVMMAPTAVIT